VWVFPLASDKPVEFAKDIPGFEPTLYQGELLHDTEKRIVVI
jgi:hypothetical protein